jgi:hypothetical protein
MCKKGKSVHYVGRWFLATGCWQLVPYFLPEARSEKPGAKLLTPVNRNA